MASILKRGDSYSVRYKYKDHSGKPCDGWESFKTKKEAQERKITVEKELLDGTFLVPDTMTVEEMLYKWIPIQSTKHKWSPKTYTQSVAMVQNLIVPYIGNRKVQELCTYDIEKFYATLAKTPCGQYVHGVKQKLSEKQKKRLLSSTSIHEVHTLLKTAFSYAVEWDLIHKIPLPRDAPKVNIEERTIWDEKTMLAALQTIENPALHLAVHMSMILSLREGEILGLQPSDLDFDAADGRGTISVSKTMQRANKDALEKLDPNQVYYTFPDRREGSKSSLILKKPKTKKSNRVLYMTKPLKEELQAWLEKLKQDEQSAPEKYSNCGQLFRLPDGLPIAPELLTKWYRLWRAEHPEFEQIVFHGLRHPYVKPTTKIFSLRLMDFQAQAYPDARRKTRGACQLHRGEQSQSPVRPLCNRKRFSCLPPQAKMSWILYAISMRLSGYTSTRSISSSASSVVSVSASKIALDASLRLSCRACSSCFCFACANTAA